MITPESEGSKEKYSTCQRLIDPGIEYCQSLGIHYKCQAEYHDKNIPAEIENHVHSNSNVLRTTSGTMSFSFLANLITDSSTVLPRTGSLPQLN